MATGFLFLKKHISLFFLAGVLISCTDLTQAQTDVLGNVSFDAQGQSIMKDEMTRKLCKEFVLTPSDVKHFYNYSRPTTEQEIHDEFDILPCFSTGKIVINGTSFNWRIRAGGTGAFYNDRSSLLRVCEKKCCDKLKNLC